MNNLIGKFIELKTINNSHAELVVKWRNSDHAKFINKGSSNIEDQIKWINNRPDNEYNFIIYFRDEAVGQISLYNINKVHKTADAGRLILDKNLQKGYPITFESILLIYSFAFYKLNLNKISGLVASSNIGAIKLNDFVKMRREGILRQQFIFDNGFQDAIVFGILKNEFIEIQEPFLKKIINLNLK
jgi:RimJ/RimL family protein N-acetyltransferase